MVECNITDKIHFNDKSKSIEEYLKLFGASCISVTPETFIRYIYFLFMNGRISGADAVKVIMVISYNTHYNYNNDASINTVLQCCYATEWCPHILSVTAWSYIDKLQAADTIPSAIEYVSKHPW